MGRLSMYTPAELPPISDETAELVARWLLEIVEDQDTEATA